MSSHDDTLKNIKPSVLLSENKQPKGVRISRSNISNRRWPHNLRRSKPQSRTTSALRGSEHVTRHDARRLLAEKAKFNEGLAKSASKYTGFVFYQTERFSAMHLPYGMGPYSQVWVL